VAAGDERPAGVDELAAPGHDEVADEVRTRLVGRNVIEGRWTFPVIEEFDDLYAGITSQRCRARSCGDAPAG
jgi:hypothetical protein